MSGIENLLAVIMNFLEPNIDEFLARIKGDKEMNLRFPSHISDALNIIRHDKVPRQGKWVWLREDDPPFDPKESKIADGYLDK